MVTDNLYVPQEIDTIEEGKNSQALLLYYLFSILKKKTGLKSIQHGRKERTKDGRLETYRVVQNSAEKNDSAVSNGNSSGHIHFTSKGLKLLLFEF